MLDVLCTVHSVFLLQRTQLGEHYFPAKCSVTQELCQVDIIKNPVRF